LAEKVKISVVLPTYQEKETINTVLDEISRALDRTGWPYEIIVIDDGSTDGTWERLSALSADWPDHLRVLRHPYNKGNGAAVKTGIMAARGEFIACMDSDGQHDPAEMVKLLPYAEEYDLVVGSRIESYQGSWYRKLANRVYSGLASWLAQFPIDDLTSGLRIFRSSVVKKYAALFPHRFSYPTTSTLIFLRAGYNLKYVRVKVRPRQGGVSKINTLQDGRNFVIIILKIIVLYEPLKVFLPVAGLSLGLGALLTAINIWISGHFHITNTAIFLFLFGVLVFLLGLIAEQIAALQVTRRNDYD